MTEEQLLVQYVAYPEELAMLRSVLKDVTEWGVQVSLVDLYRILLNYNLHRLAKEYIIL